MGKVVLVIALVCTLTETTAFVILPSTIGGDATLPVKDVISAIEYLAHVKNDAAANVPKKEKDTKKDVKVPEAVKRKIVKDFIKEIVSDALEMKDQKKNDVGPVRH